MSEQALKQEKVTPFIRAAWIGWALVGTCVFLVAAGLILLYQPSAPWHPLYQGWEAVLPAASFLVVAMMGGIIISHHARHAIGWLFVLVSLMLALDLFAFSYAAFGLIVNPGSLPGGAVMGAIADEVLFPAQFGLILALLLFPDGRFLSPRWRTAAWLMGIAVAASNIIWLLAPGSLNELPLVQNPFALNLPLYYSFQPFAALVSNYFIPLFLLAGVLSLTLRFRQGNQIQKQQIKWFIFGSVPFAIGALVRLLLQTDNSLGDYSFVMAGLITLPVAMAIAILKHRLYDIDLLMNRALVYGVLTGSITLFYVVVVSATGYFLQTGSNLATLLITGVIVAAVLRPLYSHIQRGADRVIARSGPPTVPAASQARISADQPVDWLLLAQIVWSLLAIAALVILVAALPGYAAKFGGQLGHATGTTLPPGSRFFAAASGAASLASALLSVGLSALLFRRKFGEPMAVLLSFFLLLYGIVFGGPLEFAASYWLGSAQLGIMLQGLVVPTPLIALLLLFPNGRFVPGWTRWVLLLVLPWNVALLWLVPFDAASISRAPLLLSVVAVLFIGFALAGIYAQICRYRRAATYNERQQIRWAAYGFALWIGYILVSSIPYVYLSSLPPHAPTPWWGPASELGWWLSLSILPLCLTIAVTRYRLWDIDVLINRTLVYGVLTAAVLGLYGLLVGGMGLLFQTQGNWLVTLVITGLVAVLFQPLRSRLQQSVNRLLYGHRDEPLEVLARLGQQLENALPPEQVLPTLVETIAQTLKLPYAAITMALYKGQGSTEQTAATYGKPRRQVQTFPLVYQGSTIGHLHVAPRATEETFTPAEARLLQNIARQSGTAVHALQLTADLQQARQQIVSSREEERRRLRRDLHDGLGPSLAATLLKIGSARALLANQPETTENLLAEMESDIETTLADVRRIVYDLRPPALDQFGLVGALRAYAEACESETLTVRLDAPESLPPLPAAVEVAAYHIGREGLTNVVRHAGARHCTLKLWLENGRLHLTLHDNGIGLADNRPAGVGLAAMRERAAELGGSCTIEGEPGKGVLVTAVLPIRD